MSQRLPAQVRNDANDRTLAVPGQHSPASSALARMAISLAPDLLRVAERIVLNRDRQPAKRQTSQGMHGHSIQMSEVEIDTSIPFVRRVTVRNASSWSTFPVEVEPEPPGRSYKAPLIGASGVIALAAALMLRRAIPSGRIIDVPGRQRD